MNATSQPTQYSDDADAMDKVCSRYDVNSESRGVDSDAMETILQPIVHTESELLVETAVMTTSSELENELWGETLKPCCISVIRLESILLDNDPTLLPVDAQDLPTGEHFTKKGVGRKPRKANTCVQYDYHDDNPDNSLKPHKQDKPLPYKSGPSDERIHAQSRTTEDPLQKKNPIPSLSSLNEEPDEDEEDQIPLKQQRSGLSVPIVLITGQRISRTLRVTGKNIARLRNIGAVCVKKDSCTTPRRLVTMHRKTKI